MAIWQMEMWDNRVEDELFWRRVDETEAEYEGQMSHREMKE